MRTCLCPALALMLALVPGASRSEQQPMPSPAPAFPAGVEIVNVDVVVLDRRGNPLEGLTQADFVVKEDGRPQTISSFEAIALAESLPEPRRRQTRVSTNTSPPTPGDRWFLVVFDDANLSQYATPRAQEAIVGFVTQGLRAGDQVMIVPTSGGAWWTGRLPEGRDSLVAFVKRLRGGRRPDTTAARIWDYEAMSIALDRDPQILGHVARRYFENNLIPEAYPTDREVSRELDVSPGLPLIRAKAREVYREATVRLRSTLDTLERVSASLVQLRGRKTLLLVSEGFIMDPSQIEFRELIQTARNANAAVHFIDARSPEGVFGQAGMAGGGAEFGRAVEERDSTRVLALASREAEGARSVAIDTGGSIVSGTAGLADAMVKIARESRAHYLMGYASTNPRRDGKFRKIEVAVARPDVEVRARRGYYAPSDKEQRAPGKDLLHPAVRAGLDAPFDTTGIPLRLTSYVLGRQADGKVHTSLVAEADLAPLRIEPRDGRYEAKLDSYVVVHGHDSGEIQRQATLVELAMPDEVYQRIAQVGVPLRREFSLAPGRYQVRLLVRDRNSGRLGSVRHEFEVPDAAQFRVSTPVLTDSFQPAEAGQPPRPVPIARRSFRPGSRLACAFEVFGAAPDPAGGGPRVSVAYRLRRPDGTELAVSPLRRLNPTRLGELPSVIVLTLPEAAEGEHELVLTVRDEISTATLEVLEPFVVSRQ